MDDAVLLVRYKKELREATKRLIKVAKIKEQINRMEYKIRPKYKQR